MHISNRAFMVAATLVLNSLPQHITSAVSLPVLRNLFGSCCDPASVICAVMLVISDDLIAHFHLLDH